MREHLYVAGTDLATYGVYISGDGTFSAPEREFTTYTVPNRNGALLGASTRLENISVTYKCFIYTNLDTNIKSLRAFLLSHDGYVKISDTYHPNEYRMGLYAGPFEPTIRKTLDAGSFDLTFFCMPQRWLTSGDTVITKTASGVTTLANPTLFIAKPLVRAYGAGSFSIYHSINGSQVGVTVTIASHIYSYCDIDCESMNCYYDDKNLNSYVSFAEFNTTNYGVDAPVIYPGNNGLTMTGLTKVELTPRWWEV